MKKNKIISNLKWEEKDFSNIENAKDENNILYALSKIINKEIVDAKMIDEERDIIKIWKLIWKYYAIIKSETILDLKIKERKRGGVISDQFLTYLFLKRALCFKILRNHFSESLSLNSIWKRTDKNGENIYNFRKIIEEKIFDKEINDLKKNISEHLKRIKSNLKNGERGNDEDGLNDEETFLFNEFCRFGITAIKNEDDENIFWKIDYFIDGMKKIIKGKEKLSKSIIQDKENNIKKLKEDREIITNSLNKKIEKTYEVDERIISFIRWIKIQAEKEAGPNLVLKMLKLKSKYEKKDEELIEILIEESKSEIDKLNREIENIKEGVILNNEELSFILKKEELGEKIYLKKFEIISLERKIDEKIKNKEEGKELFSKYEQLKEKLKEKFSEIQDTELKFEVLLIDIILINNEKKVKNKKRFLDEKLNNAEIIIDKISKNTSLNNLIKSESIKYNEIKNDFKKENNKSYYQDNYTKIAEIFKSADELSFKYYKEEIENIIENSKRKDIDNSYKNAMYASIPISIAVIFSFYKFLNSAK